MGVSFKKFSGFLDDNNLSECKIGDSIFPFSIIFLFLLLIRYFSWGRIFGYMRNYRLRDVETFEIEDLALTISDYPKIEAILKDFRSGDFHSRSNARLK